MSEPSTTGKRGRDDDVGNLGWLASSGVLPRKRKEIEGVGGSSILELQAQLYQAQENARLRGSGVAVPDRRTAGLNVASLMKGRNAGVEERDKKDRLELKTTADRVGECYAALERKAHLYDKLARGELPDEEDEERYEVDFLRKGMEQQGWGEGRGRDRGEWGEDDDELGGGRGGRGGPVDTALAAVSGTGGMVSGDMLRERERRSWEEEQQRVLEEEEAEARRRKQKEDLLSMAVQTREERERAQAAAARREEAARSKRDQLKQEFLKRQLSKVMAAKKQ